MWLSDEVNFINAITHINQATAFVKNSIRIAIATIYPIILFKSAKHMT